MMNVQRDYEAEARAWEAHGWPTDGESLELCFGDDAQEQHFEDVVRVSGYPWKYLWTCPVCDMDHESRSDAEVAVSMAHSWQRDAGKPCPSFCGECAERAA